MRRWATKLPPNRWQLKYTKTFLVLSHTFKKFYIYIRNVWRGLIFFYKNFYYFLFFLFQFLFVILYWIKFLLLWNSKVNYAIWFSMMSNFLYVFFVRDSRSFWQLHLLLIWKWKQLLTFKVTWSSASSCNSSPAGGVINICCASNPEETVLFFSVI